MKIKLFTNISLILVLLSILSSCIATRRVEKGEHLLKNNILYVNGKRDFSSGTKKYIRQQPNTTFFGFYPVYLHLYNLAEEDPKGHAEEIRKNNKGMVNFLNKAFSEKSVNSLENDYISIQEWVKETGEEPVILDSVKTVISTERLSKYYNTQGYFLATSSDTSEYNYKTAKVKYFVNTGPAYFLDSISYQIDSESLVGLFNENLSKTFIKKGAQYRLEDMYSEQERITELFRNNGFYNFERSFIKISADTNKGDHTLDLKLRILNRPVKNDFGTSFVPHRQYRINKVNIYPDRSFINSQKEIADSIEKNGFYFLAYEKNRFKPRALTDAIYMEPGKLYSDEDRKESIKLLSSLGMFKLTDIRVIEDSSDVSGTGLISEIYLTPTKRNTGKIELEGTNSNTLGLGLASNISYTNRNTFRGAEILDISINAMVGNQGDVIDDVLFNAYQYGVTMGLQFPRFLLPWNTENMVPKSMRPRTRFSLSLNNQLNIGLSNNSYNTSVDYTWNESDTKEHTIRAYNLQYIKYLNSANDYFSVNETERKNIEEAQDYYLSIYPEYTELEGQIELINLMVNDKEAFDGTDLYSPMANSVQRFARMTQNYLISSSSYTFLYNNQRVDKEKSFLYFKGQIELAGTMFTLLDKIKPLDEFEDYKGNKYKTILGQPYAQFVKIDLDFRKYWRLNSTDRIAFRMFSGISLPFGNSTDIPFERSYFAGGVSDIRAWRPYALGPGGVQDYPFDYSYDKFKLTASLEYRVKLFGQLHGAFFVDAGNIWGLDNEDESINFKFNTFYRQLGVGTGYGIRYDFNFFVFRLDMGYKTVDPGRKPGERFVLKEQRFFNPQVNFAIGYPF